MDYDYSIYYGVDFLTQVMDFIRGYYAWLIIAGIIILVLWCVIFKRSGVFPLFAIIPGFNILLLYAIAERRRALIATIVLSVIGILLREQRLVTLLCMLGIICCEFSFANGLSDVFKHKSVFILPLVILLFPVIGYAIIAFGKNGRYEPLQSPFAK